ncbi:peptidase S8/S53 domain-containing protein [Mycena galericulata]|nr:peptidase S8/S53 domain-containing protein [Mycena galericulata]
MRTGGLLVISAWLFATSTVLAAPVEVINRCLMAPSLLACVPGQYPSSSSTDLTSMSVSSSATSTAVNTSEFQSISRDLKAVESRKRAIGQSWNLARLATANTLQPGSKGQGASDMSSDWTVNLKDDLGQGVYIYVIDTGVDGNHPLLRPRVATGKDLKVGTGDVEGDGHGTGVAGAAAATNFGVASGAVIIPIKLYPTAEMGDLSDLINGIAISTSDFELKKALNPDAAAVINISVDTPNDPSLQTEIAYASFLSMALKLGMHVVIAAASTQPFTGNEARDRSNDWITMRSNQNVQAAINVGAINICDNLATFPTTWAPGSHFDENVQVAINIGAINTGVDNFATFPTTWAPGSNFGEGRQYLSLCMDIYAEGYNILTSGPNQDMSQLAFGTSMAAPQVAGIIAGVISLHGNMAPADMKTYILSIGATNKITGLSGSSNNFVAQFPSSFLG